MLEKSFSAQISFVIYTVVYIYSNFIQKFCVFSCIQERAGIGYVYVHFVYEPQKLHINGALCYV